MHDGRKYRHDPQHHQTGEYREDDLGGAITPQTGKELRSDLVAHREKEEEKDEGLERPRYRNIELPDEHARKKRRRHVAQIKPRNFERSDEIADCECQKDRQFGVLLQHRDEPR